MKMDERGQLVIAPKEKKREYPLDEWIEFEEGIPDDFWPEGCTVDVNGTWTRPDHIEVRVEEAVIRAFRVTEQYKKECRPRKIWSASLRIFQPHTPNKWGRPERKECRDLLAIRWLDEEVAAVCQGNGSNDCEKDWAWNEPLPDDDLCPSCGSRLYAKPVLLQEVYEEYGRFQDVTLEIDTDRERNPSLFVRYNIDDAELATRQKAWDERYENEKARYQKMKILYDCLVEPLHQAAKAKDEAEERAKLIELKAKYPDM